MIIKLMVILGKVLTALMEKLLSYLIERVQLKLNPENESRSYKSMLYMGLIFCAFAVFFGSPVIFSDNINKKIEGLISFLVVIPLGAIPLVLYLNLKYSYDPYGFSYRNFFRKTYKYSYSQINELNVRSYGAKLKMDNGKRIYIFSALINDRGTMINTMLKYMEDKNVS